jgi:signal transduction histidine kinase
MGLKGYLLLFLILMLMCWTYTSIFRSLVERGDNPSYFYAMLSLMTYLAIISALLTVSFALYRKRHVQRPLGLLGEAARKVAQGDYSVRLEPLRRDGKKDEFEVLFEDFNTMVTELGSTEIMKNDFISNVSHELKTPLAVMQNYATILQSDGLEEAEKREYAKKIADATMRLSVLVSNILQINRLENQKIVTHRVPFNLSEQISRCAVGYERIWEEKNIELTAELDQNIILTSDEDLLDIVWNNLISNALKFTAPEGTVHIRARQEAGTITVTVGDSGCGIEPEALRHIFDKFYQADESHATQGNGLGLALVKQIVELLGGTVSVSSTVGKGSTFTVYLQSL